MPSQGKKPTTGFMRVPKTRAATATERHHRRGEDHPVDADAPEPAVGGDRQDEADQEAERHHHDDEERWW